MSRRLIDLGTAVRIATGGGVQGRPGPRTEEGVVIEVVARPDAPCLLRALHDPCRGNAMRYVIQCDGFRELCLARDLLVVSL